ncbi:MAG: hypothetical protein V4450_17180 [Bacteroidota bacterium]
MKKNIAFFLVLFLPVFSLHACEICGCGVGNFYMGQLPGFKSKFIGIRYQYMSYHSELASDKSQFSNDSYQTTEIWSGLNIGNRWQVLAFVPWQFNKKISDDGITHTSGVGDISLLANYRLVHTLHTNNHNHAVEQELLAGAGIKLATGKYQVDLSNPVTNTGDVNSQNGTGSNDLLLNAIYQLRIGKTGFSSFASYKWSGTNSAGYRFGNRITLSALGYHRFRFSGIGLSPNLGLLFEKSAGNTNQHEPIEQTGGYVLNATGGIEVNFNKITLGLNTQLPISQRFSEGQTRSLNRTVLHLSFAL